MNVPDSQRLSLFVTHVSAESTFIKLWAQLDLETSEKIEACLTDLEPKFEMGLGKQHPVDIHKNDICCAKCSEDGKWYRAQITNLTLVLQSKIGVKFIDYGNSEMVQIQEIRKTDNPVCDIAPQATEFILAGVKPIGATWDDKTVAFITEILRYQEVQAKVARRVGSVQKIHIAVVYNDVVEDLGNLLIRMRMGEKEGHDLNLKYTQQYVDTSEECTVYMANVTSLSEFVVNLTETEDDLHQLNEDVNKYATEMEMEKLGNLKIGSPCLAKFSQEDSFYRAEIYGINNNTYRIYYVDYGNSDLKQASDLYEIPASLVTQLPVQGLKCRLKECRNIPETDAIIQLFKTKTMEKELKCRFLVKNPGDTFVVDLVDESGTDLTELLKESRLKLISNNPVIPSFIPQRLQVGNAHEVEITHVESLNSFYIRLLTLRNCYEELVEQLFIEMNASVNPLMEKEIILGLACVVRKNFAWYRCQVVQIVTPGLVRVQYVDIGNVDVVPTTRLKRLPSAYTRDPPVLAKACALNNCTHISPDLSFDLERMTACSTLLAQIKGEENGILLVDLFNVLAIPHVEINKHINELTFTDRVIIKDPLLEDIETIYVMNVDDNGVIYGQLTKFSTEKLDDMQSKLNLCYSNSKGKVTDLNDRFCCADFSEDEMFYRGEILKDDKGNVEVYFVDYGNVEVKPRDRVKKLDPAFAILPRQIVTMKLIGEDILVDEEYKNVFVEATMEVQFLQKSKKLSYFILTSNSMNVPVKHKLAALQINQATKKVERTPKCMKSILKYETPIINDKENVMVTHCVSPNFIGCQLQKNAADLRELCEVTTGSAKEPDAKKRKLQSPFVGQACIADYYGDWYRAEIKQVCANEEIEVTYVDFGNSETIHLDLVQTAQTKFLSLPKQCIFCKLDGCDEINWTNKENEILDEIIKEKNLVAVFNFVGAKKEPYLVTLFDGHQNLNHKFLKTVRPDINLPTKNFSFPETSNYVKDKHSKNSWNSPENDPKPQYNSNDDYNSNRRQNFSYEEKKRSFSGNNTNNKQTNGWNKPNFNPTDQWNGASADYSPPTPTDTWNDNTEMRKQLKHSPFSICETNFYTGNYKCITLNPGTTKDIVTCFITSLDDFYVQLNDNTEQLDSMSESLAAEYNDDYQTLTDMKINSPCCVKYSEDGSWYRAMITSINGTEIGVKYVDYGNTDTVNADCVKGLKREFGEFPIQAIKCSLNNVKAINDDTVLISDLILEKDFSLQVVRIGKNGNYVVDLLDSTNLVSQLLVDQGLASFEKMAAKSFNNVELAVGTTSDVTLTWFVSPTCFYVNSHTEKRALDRIMNEIQDFYDLKENSTFSVPEWKEGVPCAAQFSEDDVWYRARIVAVMDDGLVRVEYVDFGNGEITNKKKILGLEMKFAELPPQGIKCKLRSVRPVGLKWEKIPQNKMELYFGKKSSCTFYAFHKDAFLVDVENEGQSVAQSLVNDGFAQFSSVCSTSLTSASSEEPINPYAPFQLEWTKDEYKDVVVCSLGRIDRFWCQLVNSQKPTLATRLNEHYGALSPLDQKLSNPKKGTACVIKSARDENWYRAVVQNRPSPSKLCVLCVDMGMEEVIHISQAKVIAPQFLEHPIAAFPCSLAGVTKNVDPDVFIRATYMKELVAQITDQVADWFEVILFELNGDEEKNLNELLAATVVVTVPEPEVIPSDSMNSGCGSESKWIPYFVEKQLDPDSFDLLASYATLESDWAIGEEKKVRITNFGNPRAFWCQFASTQDDINVLQQALEDYYANKSRDGNSNWAACKPCVIKSKTDNKWYRASVIRRRSLDEIEVLLIDVGLEDDVSENDMWEISEEFLKIAPHSFCCRLSDFKDIQDTEGVVGQFLSLVGEELTAKLHNISDKKTREVSLYNLSSGDPENILSLLTGKATNEPDTQFLPSEVQWESGLIKHVSVTGPGLPDQFWCQLKDHEEKFDNLSQEMAAYYNLLTNNEEMVVPTVGKSVVVQSKIDQKWHRAIVQSITNSNKVMVSFVDTGEWDKVGINQIKAITPEFISRPVLALECRLSGIPENAEVRKMGYDFFDMIVDKKLKAALNNRNGTVFEVTLFDILNGEEVNLNKKLVSIYQGKLTETTLTYKSPVIISGFQDGYISHVTNPRHFYVQMVLIQDDLLELNEQLSAIYSTMEPNESTLPSNSLPGQPCCAPFEDAWYRGELLSADGNCAVVKFIDYGNCETISRNKVKQLDAEIVNSITPLAIECRLANAPVKAKWSADETDNFLNMVLDKHLSVEFITTEEPCTVLIREKSQSEPVKLPGWDEKPTQPQISQKNDILDEIISANTETDLIYQVFPASKRLLGGTSHIVSPGQFWVQLDDYTKQLDQITEILEDVYVTNSDQAAEMSQSELCTGMSCAAQYSQDGFWYRGKVLAVELNDVHVQFVDYGNSDTVKFSAVRRLTPELLRVPVLAVECELDGVCQQEDEWSIEAIEQFEELVSEKSLLVVFERQSGHKYFVKMMDTGVDVAEEMGKKGFATLKEGYKKTAITNEVAGVESESVDVATELQEASEVKANETQVCESEVLEVVNGEVDVELDAGIDESDRKEEAKIEEQENKEDLYAENDVCDGKEEELEVSDEENGPEEKVDAIVPDETKGLEEPEREIGEAEKVFEEKEFDESETVDEETDLVQPGPDFVEETEPEKSSEPFEDETQNYNEEELKIEIPKSIEGDEEELKTETSKSIEEDGELETETPNSIEGDEELETETPKSIEGDEELETKIPKSIVEEELKTETQKSIEGELETETQKSIDDGEELETETLKTIEDEPKQSEFQLAGKSPICISYSAFAEDKSIQIESIAETGADFANPEPANVFISLEDSLDLSPGEISSDMHEESFTTADDVISYEDARVELSEQSGGFDTQSLLLDEEEDLFGSEEPSAKLPMETFVSDNDSVVTEGNYQASVSCNLDSTADASQFLDVSCTTASSSFEYEKVGPPTKKQKTEDGKCEKLIAEIKRQDEDKIV
uniref:Tudor domain-containing protein n=1 Tax=Strigamia maritima TaxID=126957 RepID=T1J079_STRMM